MLKRSTVFFLIIFPGVNSLLLASNANSFYIFANSSSANEKQAAEIVINQVEFQSMNNITNTVTLPLFEKTLELTVNRQEIRSSSSWTWSAASGQNSSQLAVVTVDNENVRATIYDSKQTFSIYNQDGRHFLVKRQGNHLLQ